MKPNAYYSWELAHDYACIVEQFASLSKLSVHEWILVERADVLAHFWDDIFTRLNPTRDNPLYE